MKSLLRIFAAILLGVVVPAVAGKGSAALSSDLHEPDARRDDLLYVVLFSLPECPYCVAVRQAYLPALPEDPRFRERVRIREVRIGDPRTLSGFDGAPVSHAALAKRYGVKFAPTVLFLDAAGQPRAEPLLGGDSVGLYGGYLEKRVMQGLGLLPRPD
ncbi:MAG TPA: hypothetical protein PLN96_10000 [Zoogloea sp.]|uniref:thioredoxin fold domain-containing protein n=1 Tax=Zoogloea sp. TaxID=49181 RepID=UPI002BDB6679|nr:thioredoxin fold domain-containing protein [Zoogloea sp.]HMV17724.1 hypothetical protein [Rhodocyclaceae bacterium]HMV62183.1 hypothetical protein [Rhodocyclaceae bacterium]HMW51847.1 hypothetical protein [Rhodocyclaceae bacterium]HMY49980.1 hypothetical protein [Rhodocyclaceae bacterium]HMZ77810.1 hypothetical protein [Rhodocyclaceae bacterium]